MKKYIVSDSTGHKVGIPFKTRRDAEQYKAIYGRFDWTIAVCDMPITRKSTPKQREAVSFIEEWLDISFKGNIEDFYEISDFLDNHLEIAKELALDAYSYKPE